MAQNDIVDDRSEPPDSGDESDPQHSPDSYYGSQYSSGDSDGEDRVGFMRDYQSDGGYGSDYDEYTLGSPIERMAAIRDDPGSGSELEIDEVVLQMNFGEYFRSITEQPNGEKIASVEPKPVRYSRSGKRPERKTAEKRCLAAWVELNGIKAFALFDSGSTADAVSPHFARVAKMRVYQLENPVTLQLGTKGSKSRITYGCTTSYSISPAKQKVEGRDYFDIANVDRYDAVVGTVFMRRHGISLDFGDDTVKMKGSVVPTLSEGEELTELVRRASKRVADNIAIGDREEIEVKPRPRKEPTYNLKPRIPKATQKNESIKRTEQPETSQKHEK
ncbi:hypothetical protein PM082_014973 [Marasmius tenuissimus]|nr:hypothetical protein PM082_014973 [Marasmius tenuissimus]